MKTETLTVNVIKAEKGKILTDGNIYGRMIYLAKNRSPEEFHEITEAEYDAHKRKQWYMNAKDMKNYGVVDYVIDGRENRYAFS